MNCPDCRGDTLVIDSRHKESAQSDMGYHYRRRKCRECGRRITTYEFSEAYVRALLSDQAGLKLLRDALAGTGKFAEKGPKKLPKLLQSVT